MFVRLRVPREIDRGHLTRSYNPEDKMSTRAKRMASICWLESSPSDEIHKLPRLQPYLHTNFSSLIPAIRIVLTKRVIDLDFPSLAPFPPTFNSILVGNTASVAIGRAAVARANFS